MTLAFVLALCLLLFYPLALHYFCMCQSMVEPCLLLLVNLAIRCNGTDARLYRFRFPSVLPVIVEKEKKKSSAEAELLSCCLPDFEANECLCW